MPPTAAVEKPGERLGDELILIQVGPERKQFSVHKKLLRSSSPFFDKAFQANAFKEGIEGVLYLPDDHPVALGLYVEWIYRLTIPDGHSQSYVDGLYHLWILADKLCLPTSALKDAVMDKIQDVSSAYNLEPRSAMVQLVFEQTAKKSHLRLYCIDVIAFSLLLKSELRKTDHEAKRLAGILDDELEQVYEMTTRHPDIFKYLFYEAIGFAKMKALSDPRARYRLGIEARCWYHEHAEGDCHSASVLAPPFIQDAEADF
ncbi:hypothetical protein BKA61DRAFT_677972 [Leptodontidium sp. MPI-SDFR-AT-0119]|nr:hypothetical protein BKA61DRAFT_677972 [Leptodontidium sp. MPI-SDFR-AT-0119]